MPRPTVLEVLAIAITIVVVATFVTPESFRSRSDPRAAARSDLTAIGAAIETYRYDTGHLPTTAEGLAALVDVPPWPRRWTWRGPYVVPRIPLDPWGRAYLYRRVDASGGEGYRLASYGADGKPGGHGDNADVAIRP
ncbi:MAG: type II secretion system major pseudopilin GspG [Gemmatimonadaceae bacterium]